MPNAIKKIEDTYTANATDEEVGSISPPSGGRYDTVGIWFDQDANTDYSVSIEETKVMDNVAGANLPGPADPLPFTVRLQQGDHLRLLATDTNATAAEVAMFVLVDQESRG